eukprot:2666089-Prymnesium_polylepis.1
MHGPRNKPDERPRERWERGPIPDITRVAPTTVVRAACRRRSTAGGLGPGQSCTKAADLCQESRNCVVPSLHTHGQSGGAAAG